MAKARKNAEPPHILAVGDKVRVQGKDTVYEITRVSPDGREADVCFRKTNLEWFRVPVELLEWVK